MLSHYVYAVNPAVDVYKIGDDILEFYFINTRRRITMKVTPSVVALVNLLDGESELRKICLSIDIPLSDDVISFVEYLYAEKVLILPRLINEEAKLISSTDHIRYDRQLNYFNSLYSGSEFAIQKKIENEIVLILGVGAIGSGIAMQLVMSGVRNLILVDKDIVTKDSLGRHFWYSEADLGKTKVNALSEYLNSVDSLVSCECYHTLVDFDTSLDSWLARATFVINTLDEPYVGVTSLKVGRACYELNTPLYVAGGFDAHLMSTGELIVPDKTPCVDCYTSFFSDKLKDWDPKYNVEALSEEELDENRFEVGGLASMSLFSISYAVIVILNYWATGDPSYSRGRGELLFDNLEIEYLNIPKNPDCHVCGNKR